MVQVHRFGVSGRVWRRDSNPASLGETDYGTVVSWRAKINFVFRLNASNKNLSLTIRSSGWVFLRIVRKIRKGGNLPNRRARIRDALPSGGVHDAQLEVASAATEENGRGREAKSQAKGTHLTDRVVLEELSTRVSVRPCFRTF